MNLEVLLFSLPSSLTCNHRTPPTDACHAVGDGYGGQANAAREHRLHNVGHAVRERWIRSPNKHILSFSPSLILY